MSMVSIAPCSWAIFCSNVMACTSVVARSRGECDASCQGSCVWVTVWSPSSRSGGSERVVDDELPALGAAAGDVGGGALQVDLAAVAGRALQSPVHDRQGDISADVDVADGH